MMPQQASYKTGEKALTKGQVDKLLDSIPDLADLAFLMLAIDIGARREDVVQIREKDVHLETSKVSYSEKKKKGTIRTVEISPKTRQTLEMWLNVKKTLPIPTKWKVWLFPARDDKSKSGHVSSRTAYNILNRYLERVGLKPRPFHSLRSTCYKLCKARGWSATEAAHRIGDTLKVAEEHYGTPSEEEMNELMRTKPLL